ncbi:MAG: response regulator [Desulfuromonadaceae bacterium]|nr:response regulator [Desulfuromonadaceae bacterium]MDD2854608.1 response regulator [Desulfuromonadaceae bacterium]
MNTTAKHILVVDDDPFTAELTGMILESSEYEIIIADGGVDALEKLNSDDEISIVVSDMNMPFVSGVQLFEEMRGQGFTIPFVLLTGEDSAPLRLAHPDMDEIVTKDENLQETLPEIVDSLIAKRG